MSERSSSRVPAHICHGRYLRLPLQDLFSMDGVDSQPGQHIWVERILLSCPPHHTIGTVCYQLADLVDRAHSSIWNMARRLWTHWRCLWPFWSQFIRTCIAFMSCMSRDPYNSYYVSCRLRLHCQTIFQLTYIKLVSSVPKKGEKLCLVLK